MILIEACNPFERPLHLTKGRYVGRAEISTSRAGTFIGGSNNVIATISSGSVSSLPTKSTSISPSSDPSDSDATDFIEDESAFPQRIGFDTDDEAHTAIDQGSCPVGLTEEQWNIFK